MANIIVEFCEQNADYYVDGSRSGTLFSMWWGDVYERTCPTDVTLSVNLLQVGTVSPVTNCIGSINTTFCSDSFRQILYDSGGNNVCWPDCSVSPGGNAINSCLSFDIDFTMNARPCTSENENGGGANNTGLRPGMSARRALLRREPDANLCCNVPEGC